MQMRIGSSHRPTIIALALALALGAEGELILLDAPASLAPTARRDGWARLRTSGWLYVFRTLIGLSSLAVVELALCRLHALTRNRKHAAPTRASTLRATSIASANTVDSAGRRERRAWNVGPAVLVLCALCSTVRFLYVVVDPLGPLGIFGRWKQQVLFAPIAAGLSTQWLQLVYLHESMVHSGGVDTLTLVGGAHKALVLGGMGGAAALLALLFRYVAVMRGANLVLAFLVVAPAVLACCCEALVLRARRTRTGAASIESQLRRLLAGNCVLTLAGLALFFTAFTPTGTMTSAFVALAALDVIAYTQCERIAPVGVRPLRGPLRRAVESAREAYRRNVHGLVATRRRLRVAPELPPSMRADCAAIPASMQTSETLEASLVRSLSRTTSRTVSLKQKRPHEQPSADRATQPRDARGVACTAEAALHAIVAAEGGAGADRVVSICLPPTELRSPPRTTDSGAPAAAADMVDGALAEPRAGVETFASSHLALGVSLSCLRDFARDSPGATAASTTSEMVAHVREMTAESRLSFAEAHIAHAASDGLPAVGRASVFVSHAQARNFEKLLDALDAFVAMHKLERENAYFWVDLLCIRQHEVAADVLRIGEVIGEIGKVAMVLDPWDKPLCLERVWCLYEIAQTVGTESENESRTSWQLPRRRSSVQIRNLRDVPFAGDETGSLSRKNNGGEQCLVRPQLSTHGSTCTLRADLEAAAAAAAAVGPAQERPRVQLFLTMSATERLKLVHAARTSRAQIVRALTRFDCRTAGASVEADRQMILAYIARMFAVDAPTPHAPAHSDALGSAAVPGSPPRSAMSKMTQSPKLRSGSPSLREKSLPLFAAAADHELPERFSFSARQRQNTEEGDAAVGREPSTAVPSVMGAQAMSEFGEDSIRAAWHVDDTPRDDTLSDVDRVLSQRDRKVNAVATEESAERAYARFNERVRLALSEAVAMLSHIQVRDS